jgi:UDP-N-acetylmuramyl pentapeptide phosphotransferase/UDP-N-acetylglucosamine-1-phosphate transferase
MKLQIGGIKKQTINREPVYDIILSFITSLLVTMYAIPSIIRVARVKHLVDEPGTRSSHETVTPSLGGIGIFAGVLISIVIWTPFELFGNLQYILASFTIIFLIGAKDDILPISAGRKFAGEFVAAVILVTQSNIRITDFQGLFGIYEIPYWFSIFISLVTILMIINAFNLIDGIDGLSGLLVVVITTFMTSWFFLVDELALSLISFSTTGACVAFLYYNISPAKIFMGDSGSLFMGLICSILAIQFVELNLILAGESKYVIAAAPVVAIGILAIPVLDTLRVFAGRILRGRSPFTAERNHIHHLTIDSGMSHMEASIVLTVLNAVIIYLVIRFQHIGINYLLLGLVAIYLLYVAIVYKISRGKKVISRESVVEVVKT